MHFLLFKMTGKEPSRNDRCILRINFEVVLPLGNTFKVLCERSSPSFGCLTIGFAVSRSDLRSEFRVRGSQMCPGTSGTVSMSAVKCTRSSGMLTSHQSHDSYLERGGQTTVVVCPPPLVEISGGVL